MQGRFKHLPVLVLILAAAGAAGAAPSAAQTSVDLSRESVGSWSDADGQSQPRNDDADAADSGSATAPPAWRETGQDALQGPDDLSDAEREKLIAQKKELARKAEAEWDNGRANQALASAEWVLAMEVRIYGEAHRDVERTLEWIVEHAVEAGLYDRAAKHAPRLRRVARAVYEITDYRLRDRLVLCERAVALAAMTPEQLARLREADEARRQFDAKYDAVDYAGAIDAGRRLLELMESVWGRDSPELIDDLRNVGAVAHGVLHDDQSVALIERAAEIAEAVYGPLHPVTAQAISGWAVALSNHGNDRLARQLLEKALAAFEQTLGPDDLKTARTQYFLGAVFVKIDRDALALPYLEACLETRRKKQGEWSVPVAEVLRMLGYVHREMKNMDESLISFRTALNIFRARVGRDHPDTANLVLDVGMHYFLVEDYDQAETYLLEGLQICTDRLGPHPQTAKALNYLGKLYAAMREMEKAETYFRDALAMRRAVLPANHPDVLQSINNVAIFTRNSGDLEEIEATLRQSLNAAIETMGEDAVDVADTRIALGMVLLDRERPNEAEKLLREAVASRLAVLRESFGVQSEMQMLLTLHEVRDNVDAWLSATIDAGCEVDGVYDAIVAWKGAVAVDQAVRAAAQRDGASRVLYNELRQVSVQLAGLALNPSEDQAAAAVWRQDMAELRRKRRRLEAELAQASAEFRRAQQAQRIDSAVLKEALAEDEALVDFYEYWDTYLGKFGRRTYERKILAFVVRRGSPVQLVELGSQNIIKELIQLWMQSLREAPPEDRNDELPEFRLRKRLWEPIAPHLEGVTTILFSPDGVLNSFPLGALPGEELGAYLIEERILAVVPVPQLLPQLLQRQAEEAAAPRVDAGSLLVVGDVDYGAPLPGPDAPTVQVDVSQLDSADELRAGALRRFRRLEHAAEEVASVQESFSLNSSHGHVEVLSGAGATETEFRARALKSRWLHLVTHGYFLAEQATGDGDNEPGGNADDDAAEAILLSEIHPGLLTGLALAGANRDAAFGQDDGILTALEAQTLELSGVELAVLSACETGLGDQIVGGEGLLGLQRAFQIAGAHAVVASMWKVPDRETKMLMARFYANLWQGKMTKIEALREAQIWMLNGADEIDRADVPPLTWAAFVLSGEWR